MNNMSASERSSSVEMTFQSTNNVTILIVYKQINFSHYNHYSNTDMELPQLLPFPSLQQIGIIKTAIAVWNNHANTSEIDNCVKTSILKDIFERIYAIIIFKVNNLVLPRRFKDEIVKVVKYIALDLYEWLTKRKFNITLGNTVWIKLIKNIHLIQWTIRGKIDTTKTAKVLFTLEELFSPDERYQIACYFCIRDEIQVVWQQFPNEIIKFGFPYPGKSATWKITTFWTDVMTDKLINRERKLEMFNLFAKKYDNESMFAYLWSIYTDEEKEECFQSMKHLTNHPRKRVGMFLLSRMNAEQLSDFFLNVDTRILSFFARDSLFLTAANNYHVGLFFAAFCRMLAVTANQISKNRYDERYKICFADLWLAASPEFRKGVVDIEAGTSTVHFELLREAGDFGNIDLILENASEDDKETVLLRRVLRREDIDVVLDDWFSRWRNLVLRDPVDESDDEII